MKWLLAAAISVWAAAPSTRSGRRQPAPSGRRRVGTSATTPASRVTKPKASSCRTTLHGQRAERANAGGEQQPGVRNLPRSGQGALRDRRQGQDSRLPDDGAARRVGGLHDLPQQGRPRPVEGQHARRPQPVVHHLPFRAQPEVRARAAQGSLRHRHLRDVPQDRGRQAAALRPHAAARRQDGVHAPATTRTDRRTCGC